jgi:hypothetical protein
MVGLEAHRRGCLALLVLAVGVAPGCFGGDEPGAERTSARVVERDFRINAPKRLPAGKLELAVENRGPVAHELMIVRSRSARLPIRPGGTTVDEDAIEDDTVAELGPVGPGVHGLEAELEAGRYLLICNMTGHYMGGMRTRLVVQ